MPQRSIQAIIEKRKILTAPAGTTVREAARLMKQRNVGAVMVVDAVGHLVGIFTERDALFRIVAAGRDAIDSARRGEGPTVLWIELDRLDSHTNSDDHRLYRSADEIAAMRERDPVELDGRSDPEHDRPACLDRAAPASRCVSGRQAGRGGPPRRSGRLDG